MSHDADQILQLSALREQALEDGNPQRAAAIAWVLREGKRPYKTVVWWGWHSELDRTPAFGVTVPESCILPGPVYHQLFNRWAPNRAGTHSASFYSEQEAYDALFACWGSE